MGTSPRRPVLVALLSVMLSAAGARADNYAVLFAGGWDKTLNFERYYNATLSMWDIMVNTLGYDPANVQVLFADGTNTALDLNVGTEADPSYVNSNWGTVTAGGSTVVAGTRAELQGALVGLQTTLTSSDCFYFWSYDHGYNDYTPPQEDEGGLCGWNHTKIRDDEFAGWVQPYDVQSECYVFGQCHAGEMVDDLEIQPWEQRFAAWATPWNKTSSNLAWVNAWACAIKTVGLRNTCDIGQYARDNDYQAQIGAKPYGDYVGQNFDIVTNAHHQPYWKLSAPAVGDWSTDANWTTGEPTRGSNAFVDSGGRVQVTADDEAVLDFYIASQPTSTGSAEVVFGGKLTAYKEEVGYGGTGVFAHNGGTNKIDGYLILGNFGGSHGTYEMTAGTLYAEQLEVARSGQGWFYHGGGNVWVSGELALATGNIGYGVYELSGSGWIKATDECVGENGLGMFRHYAGTNIIEGTLTLGRWAGASGSYRITDGLLHVQSVVDGIGGGELIIDGGTVTVGQSLSVDTFTLGDQAGCTGTFDLGGAVQVTAARENVGFYGTGSFTQTGGTNRVTDRLFLGHRAGANGVYELGAGQLIAADETLGYYGVGSFLHGGGTHEVAGMLQLGLDADAGGFYGLSGTGQLSAGGIQVGVLGSAAFEQSGGSNTVTGDLALALLSGSDGTYLLAGGTLTVGGEIAGGDGLSEFIYDGGTLNVGAGAISVSRLSVGHTAADAQFSLFAGATVTAQDETVGVYGTGTFTQHGGTNTIANDLTLAKFAGSEGTYRIRDGSLLIGGNIVRGAGVSRFIVDGCTVQVGGGSISVGTFTLGDEAGCVGTFELASGQALSADLVQVGGEGTGQFAQTSGVTTCDALEIGCCAGGSGSAEISGGQLVAGAVRVGVGGSGSLDIASAAEVTVSGPLYFGPDSAFSAGAGACIRLAGPDAELINENSDPADLPGLEGLDLQLGPSVGGPVYVEAASGIDGGFVDNAALGAVTVGEFVGPGTLVVLVDAHDNGRRGSAGRECLFVGTLEIRGESQLDLGGVWMYLGGDVEALLQDWIDQERVIDTTIPPEMLNAVYVPADGWTKVVPEPASAAVLLAGAAALLRRKRRPWRR